MVTQYPSLNGTLVGTNIMQLFVYGNSVTKGYFTLMILIAFFLVVLFSSVIMQIRFTSRVRPETSFLAASVASLGFTVIMAQVNGLVNPFYFFLFVGLAIAGFVWVALSNPEP